MSALRSSPGHAAACPPRSRRRPAAVMLAALLALALLAPLAPRRAEAGGFSNLDFGLRRMGMFAVTAR
ncbi:MAG: hypothetical protein FJ125_17535, partial [Deltaproteobacteria bacterium]|nr:hypothetical protein [Deltaproteobacteria bacterium]